MKFSRKIQASITVFTISFVELFLILLASEFLSEGQCLILILGFILIDAFTFIVYDSTKGGGV